MNLKLGNLNNRTAFCIVDLVQLLDRSFLGGSEHQGHVTIRPPTGEYWHLEPPFDIYDQSSPYSSAKASYAVRMSGIPHRQGTLVSSPVLQQTADRLATVT